METIYTIYRILNQEKTPIYVGCTKNLKARKYNRYKNITRDKIKLCTFEVIEQTENKNREWFWIKYHLEKGYILLNEARGFGHTTNEWQAEHYKENYDKYYKEYWKKWKVDNRERYNEYMREYMRNYRTK